MPQGTLFLIVGPSGAGKDTLIAAARQRLSATHYFPRRIITRDAAGAAEDHVAASLAEFDADERAGRFAIAWQAHGTRYAIPADIAEALESGAHAVVNVSRTVVAALRAKFAPTRVILITAPPEILHARLTARARESDDVDGRVGRTIPVDADVTIVNDGGLQDALDTFLAALKG
jgi:phosphonate metabolism protein PhnN/1,5-bisphosphokinase (PRPP-forming)